MAFANIYVVQVSCQLDGKEAIRDWILHQKAGQVFYIEQSSHIQIILSRYHIIFSRLWKQEAGSNKM